MFRGKAGACLVGYDPGLNNIIGYYLLGSNTILLCLNFSDEEKKVLVYWKLGSMFVFWCVVCGNKLACLAIVIIYS
jgi:hypothetical protein